MQCKYCNTVMTLFSNVEISNHMANHRREHNIKTHKCCGSELGNDHKMSCVQNPRKAAGAIGKAFYIYIGDATKSLVERELITYDLSLACAAAKGLTSESDVQAAVWTWDATLNEMVCVVSYYKGR